MIDVIEAAGLKVEGMSFPAMVSLALGSLLQTMRDQQVIPDRSGFEYNEMMAPYHGQRSNKRKLEISDTIHRAGSAIKAKGLSKPAPELTFPSEPARPHQVVPELVPERPATGDDLRARRRLTELLQKKDLAEQGSVVWQAEDEEEYQQLYRMVYPDG